MWNWLVANLKLEISGCVCVQFIEGNVNIYITKFVIIGNYTIETDKNRGRP